MRLRLSDSAWGRSVLPILLGLAAAQAVGTLFVRQSNLHLFNLTQELTQAGWWIIPTGPARATLMEWKTAFLGGLFFTLSIGAALSLATFALLRGCEQFSRRRKLLLVLAGALWLGLLTAVNARGWALFPSLFVLFVPFVTGAAAMKGQPAGQKRSRLLRLAPVATLALLTVLWSTQLNKDLFIGIRDRLLLSNPVGRAVNDFYYRYTLYAAESFKSFEQKSVRTCRLAEIGDDRLRRRMEMLLGARDVLHAPGFEPVDLTVRQSGAMLLLAGTRNQQLETEQALFLADPNPWLLQFSSLTDRHAPFRRLTVPSLLLGFPILFYLTCYGFVRLLTGLFLNNARSILASSGICLLVGILLFIPVAGSGSVVVTESDIGAALAGGEWPRRVAALRYIENRRIEIARFPQYRQLLLSPMAVERYWLARALGTSRHSATYSDLLSLLQDLNPIVICQTYYALGQRANSAAIGLIKDKMLAADNWYTQWYGYQAIKNLGWRQTRSEPNPG